MMDRKACITAIQAILLTDRDPIGVSDISEAQDEYDAYADDIYGMMADQNVAADAVALYLLEIATQHMGLSYPELAERCDTAARAVAALQSDR